MATWISPDGFIDASVAWSDETLAYDGNTGTYAYVQQASNAWTDICKFTFSANVTNCTKIRIWVSMEPLLADFGDLDVRVWHGASFEMIFTEKCAEGAYIEGAVSVEDEIDSISIRFGGLTAKYGEQRLHEIQAYGEGGVLVVDPPAIPLGLG